MANRPGSTLQSREIESHVNISKTETGWRLSYCFDGFHARVIDYAKLADAIAHADRAAKNSAR
jgi:hypothetical protein